MERVQQCGEETDPAANCGLHSIGAYHDVVAVCHQEASDPAFSNSLPCSVQVTRPRVIYFSSISSTLGDVGWGWGCLGFLFPEQRNCRALSISFSLVWISVLPSCPPCLRTIVSCVYIGHLRKLSGGSINLDLVISC